MEVPPDLVGYVMAMEEKGEVLGKHFSEGSENEEEELVEPRETLERDFVSTGE